MLKTVWLCESYRRGSTLLLLRHITQREKKNYNMSAPWKNAAPEAKQFLCQNQRKAFNEKKRWQKEVSEVIALIRVWDLSYAVWLGMMDDFRISMTSRLGGFYRNLTIRGTDIDLSLARFHCLCVLNQTCQKYETLPVAIRNRWSLFAFGSFPPHLSVRRGA